MSRIGIRNLRGALAATVVLLPALVAMSGAHAAAQTAPSLLHTPVLPIHSQQPIIAGDVNGDGHVDLVGVLDQYVSPKLGVYLGDGVGDFSPPISTDVAPNVPIHLAGGDFDHDGRMDVAFLLGTTASVKVLFGASDGSFVDPVTLPLAAGGSGQDLTLCDATGDGNLDLVGAYADSPLPPARLTLYAGTGDGGFKSPPGQIVALDNPKLVTHGDFDGDGDVDLLAADPLHTVVVWGHGDGSFDLPETLAGITAIMPAETAWVTKTTGDLDGDGRDDIACVIHDGVREILFWKPGIGFSGTPIESEHFSPPRAGGIADLDRDGLAELLLAYSEHTIEILKPGGAVGWTVAGRYGTSYFAWSLHAIDVDEDGGLDVVSAGSFLGGPPGTATLLSGQGDGLLQNVYGLVQRPLDVAVADMTGDGFADVVAVLGVGTPAQLLRGRFDGGLDQPESIDVGSQAEQIFLVDATGDGKLDLLTTGGTAIAVAAGHDDGSFDPPVLSPVSEVIVESRLAPFGGDGLPDLALLLRDPPSYYAHQVHFLINGGGRFTDIGSTVVTPPGTDTKDFEVADLDHDQDTDLLVKWNAGYLRVFINQPTGFEPGLLQQMSGFLLGAEDYDLDGHVDVADGRSGGFEILSGDGAGGFPVLTTYPTPGLWPMNLTIVDLDGDGLLDRVVGGELAFGGTGDLWVALGLHGGSFTPYTQWFTDGTSMIVRPTDVNGDGAIDLIDSLRDGQLMVLENGQGPWSELGHSLAGVAGWSRLQGFGPLTPGSTATLRISNGPPGVPALLVAGHSTLNAPFKGGALVPQPSMFLMLGALDAQGSLQISGTWPASMPPGGSFAMQVWRPEPGAPSGFGATTAIRGTTP
jgi:hypothetical protein